MRKLVYDCYNRKGIQIKTVTTWKLAKEWETVAGNYTKKAYIDIDENRKTAREQGKKRLAIMAEKGLTFC